MDSMSFEEYMTSSVGFLVTRVALRIKFDMRRALLRKGHDITPEQWAVLMRLYGHDRMSHNELARRTLKEMPTITRILAILQKKELVIKEKDEKDRRVSFLSLTEKGRLVCEQTNGIALEVRENSKRNIQPEEIEQAFSVLQRMLRNLDEDSVP